MLLAVGVYAVLSFPLLTTQPKWKLGDQSERKKGDLR
jgi:hypothetical protein